MKIKFKVWILILALALPVAAEAGPWKWAMTLSTQGTGMHILLPYSLYYDPKVEKYYVVDPGNQVLVSFDKKGRFLKSFSAGGQLKVPVAMVKDGRGNLWVVERGANSLTYIDIKKRAVERHELTMPGGDKVYPDRLAVDGQGTMYVLDRMRGSVLALDKDLKVIKEYRIPRGRITDFKVKGDGIWALSRLEGRVYHFSPQGKLLKTLVLKGGDLMFPVSLEVDSVGNIYILDRHGGQVKVYGRQGDFRYAFLEPGKSRGRLYFPAQLVFDPMGRLCVVEEGNGRVEVFQR